MENDAEVTKFAIIATKYRDWILNDTDEGEIAVKNLLRLLTQLYGAALELPLGSPEPEVSKHVRVNDEDWRRAFDAGRRMPLDYYSSLSNPLPFPQAEPPVVGSVSDDIADIFRDVVTGLRLYEKDLIDAAEGEWNFSFRSHWGDHTTNAIRVLHCWLAEHRWF